MGLNDKSRKRNAGSWRERIQDGEALPVPKRNAKKACAPSVLSRFAAGRSRSGSHSRPHPQNEKFPQRSSRHDTPPRARGALPVRLRRRSMKITLKRKENPVPHAQEGRASRASRFSAPCCCPADAVPASSAPLTRNIRWFISWPLRILLGCCFVGIVIGCHPGVPLRNHFQPL